MRILCSFSKTITFPNTYMDALKAAGAEPIPFYAPKIGEKTEGDFADAAVNPDDFDGLLLGGGCDVNPARYGEENRECGSIDDRRDESELALIAHFAEAKKPIFGICRGSQILNVAFGGSLIQDIKTGIDHPSRNAPLTHSVTIEESTLLFPILGREAVTNSFHHQAVKEIGKGLQIAGRCALDGTVEAFAHTSLPIFAVQWHPERMAKDTPCMQKLFDTLVKYAGATGK